MRSYAVAAQAPVADLTPAEARETLDSEFWAAVPRQIHAPAGFPPRMARHAADLGAMRPGMRAVMARLATEPDEQCHIVAYQLDGERVGLAVFSRHPDMPSRIEILYLLAHPAVENAGDILLQHILNIAGDAPEITLSGPFRTASARYEALGFVWAGRSGDYVLHPDQTPAQWRRTGGLWRRRDKAPGFLVTAPAHLVSSPRPPPPPRGNAR